MGRQVGSRNSTPSMPLHRGPDTPADQKKERPCLGCQNNFMSKGIHNRLCNSCTGRSEAVYEPLS